MRFWVTKKPYVALMLGDWFVPVNQTVKEICLELIHRLTASPHQTFVCLVVESDLIKGMVIAYCRENDVFIWQACSARSVPRGIVDMVFDGIKHWARSKGLSRVSGTPNRAARIWKRRWGFRDSFENKGEVCMEI